MQDLCNLIPACELFAEPWSGTRRIRPDDLDGFVDGNCLPLPHDDETILGRWVATQARLIAGNKDGSAQLSIEGEFALLVTDKTLRGSVVWGVSDQQGNLWAGRNAFRNKRSRTLLFVWRYSQIEEIRIGSDIGTKTIHLRHPAAFFESRETAAARESWLPRGIGYRNRSAELAAQLGEAVAAYRGVSCLWSEERSGLAKERLAKFKLVDEIS